MADKKKYSYHTLNNGGQEISETPDYATEITKTK